MADTRIDRLPHPIAPVFCPPLFCYTQSHSVLDGESSSPPRPSSSRSTRPSPKKGRLLGPGNLGKTTEEEQQDLDPSESTSNPSIPVIVEEDNENKPKMVIPVSRSPPHETKMRQINEGVHGIVVRKTDGGDGDHEVASTPFPTTEDSSTEDNPAEPDEPPTQSGNSAVPGFDLPGHEVTASVAESSAVVDDPLPPLDKSKRASVDYLLLFPGSRRESDSSGEQEKGLKRKLGDRAVSESREAESIGKKASKKDITDAATTCVGTKRSREEGDKDPNPKESKRPSPPPEKTVEKAPVASSSKVVGVRIFG